MIRFAAALLLALATIGCASTNEAPDEANLNEQGASTPPDYASTQDSSETGASSGPPPAESVKPVSDAELREFARINRQMGEIQRTAREKLQSAETSKEQKTVRNETQEKVREVFEKSSMSRTRFERIGKVMRTDPELQERYRQQMRGQSR